MSQTTLSVRMDENIKRRFDDFCADVGMNASVAVNIFARAVLRQGRIPFMITADSELLKDGEYEQLQALKARLALSQASLESGEQTISISKAHELLEKKYKVHLFV